MPIDLRNLNMYFAEQMFCENSYWFTRNSMKTVFHWRVDLVTNYMYTKTMLTWIDEKISKGDAVNEKNPYGFSQTSPNETLQD